LAGLQHASGHAHEGTSVARAGLALRRRLDGPDALAVIADEANLAALLIETDELDEAERLLRRALRVYIDRYGPRHYEVAVTWHNLAAITQRRATHPLLAVTQARRAVSIKHETLGSDHPDLAVSLALLARAHADAGHSDLSRDSAKCAVALLERCAPSHPLLDGLREDLVREQSPAAF
jgi:hypothetical protein